MICCSNPIIPGFYPDPSVCRVGGYFYMVHSTFAYFPGIPVFRSNNLAHWEQIGNVLTRSSQALLQGCGHSKGIYAPTIRYCDGKFYVITTNVSGGGNFIVTAEDPAGPWSEPYYLEGAEGIDPSLFFDGDGTCYYIGQRENSAGSRYYGDCEIWIQKLDLQEMKLVGEAKAVLSGFQKNAVWPEGPHLYRRGEYYYIIHAESGTAVHHSVMAARSRRIFGPYEYCPCNPILTHRHLGKAYPVTCVGHADLFDDGRGGWYAAVLGCRPQQGYTLTGRETFLAKVSWEEDWPVVNPGVGRLEETVLLEGTEETMLPEGSEETALPEGSEEPMPPEGLEKMALPEGSEEPMPLEGLEETVLPEGSEETMPLEGLEKTALSERLEETVLQEGMPQKTSGRFLRSKTMYTFEEKTLPHAFVMLRNAMKDAARPQGRGAGEPLSLTEHPGNLRLYMKEETLRRQASPAYVAVRQQHHTFCAETAFVPYFTKNSDCAGMALVQNENNHIRVECAPENTAAWIVRVVQCRKGIDTILAQKTISVRTAQCAPESTDAPCRQMQMRICVRGLTAELSWKTGEEWQLLASEVDLTHLSTEFAGGFTGCTVGMYASGNGTKSSGYADFQNFIYRS